MVYYRRAKLIGQLLLQKKLITSEQLTQASTEQRKSGRLLGTILMRLGVINEDNLYDALSEQFGAEYIKLRKMNIHPTAIDEVPAKFVTQYDLIPINVEGNKVTVAMSNPNNLVALDNLRFLLGKYIQPVLASEGDIAEAIKRYYGVGAETIERITPAETVVEEKPAESQGAVTEDLVKVSRDPSVIHLVNELLLEAYKTRATDVHFEPYEEELRVRYRIDGILYDTSVPPTIKRFQAAIISRLKIMANLDISERRLPQDGRIKVKIVNQELDLRISILPCLFGESVVIRLLSSNVYFGLDKLGFAPQDLAVFARLVRRPHGIIFLTGPTGSGKTTTLYAALSSINSPEKKIITIEDPVEYQLKGIVQIQVQTKIGLTFAQGLRSMLRHDPNVMMVGEVRDFDTAEVAIRIALTGHLVFSTLHTNDAVGGIARLIDMGAEPFLVSSSVNAFVAQRLVRVICPHCKGEAQPSPELLNEFMSGINKFSRIKLYEGRGCEVCKYTGYIGRTAIYEILVNTNAIQRLIIKRASGDEIKMQALASGMRTLRQDGWEKALQGITTLSEVLRVTQEEERPQ